jgi:hypothetical protein
MDDKNRERIWVSVLICFCQKKLPAERHLEKFHKPVDLFFQMNYNGA